MSATGGGNESPRGRPALFLVARREILMRLRSPVFTLGTGLMVALVALGVVAAVVLGRTTPTRVGFVGPTQVLARPFATSAAALGASVTVSDVADAATGEAQVEGGSLDVLVTGTPTAPVAEVKVDLAPTLQAALDSAARQQALDDSLAAAGVDPATVAAAVAAAHVTVQSRKPVDPDLAEKALVGIAVGFTIYMALVFYGNFVAQGVVEEKATRMVEIILATVRPSQLLAGKIVGIGLVGLLQLAIVGLTALVLVGVTQVVALPAFGAAAIAADLGWFVLGFYLYAIALTAAASLVSRPEEVAGVTAPIVIFLVLSYLSVLVGVSSPTGTASTVLSVLPPFAPVLMPVLMATGDAASWQIALAIALALATAVVLTWLAGRIYANSVLRFGARVRFLDALRGK
ncbi:MAG: ABC transporter permease [Candidatus Limnocylindrales bacterium]